MSRAAEACSGVGIKGSRDQGVENEGVTMGKTASVETTLARACENQSRDWWATVLRDDFDHPRSDSVAERGAPIRAIAMARKEPSRRHASTGTPSGNERGRTR